MGSSLLTDLQKVRARLQMYYIDHAEYPALVEMWKSISSPGR